jgi:SAM-dependent methyltransferase
MASPSVLKAQYDGFASQYASMEHLPGEIVATHLLRNNVAKLPRGLRVLDLGCGTGTYARMLLEMGVAAHVVGVDVSSEMVHVGQTMETERRPAPARIEFHVADCAAPLDHLGLERASFDLVMANWIFNYAASRAELAGMWRNVVTYLKPGGRSVGLKESVVDLEDHLRRDFKYGIKYTVIGKVDDGLKIHIEANTEPKIEFDAYSLEARLYEEVPMEMGMREVKYHVPATEDLPDVAGEDMAFWKGLLDNPPCMLVTAVKLA